MKSFTLLISLLVSINISAQKNTIRNQIIDQDKALKSQVFNEDLIVQGSECVGIDCVNGESFGFDTNRFKENNLRLHFDDTSGSASFPANDWRILINDTSNGGGNHFTVQDATAVVDPFRIDAGAPTHSFRLNSQGDLGLGTSNPILKLHLEDGDTPSIRLQQNGTQGWTPYIWDIIANEANFGIRNVTNGSKIAFKVKPDALKETLVLKGDGLSVKGDIAMTGCILGVSDIRVKSDIENVSNALDIIKALQGKQYNFKTEEFKNLGLPNGKQYGLIAQDVEKVLSNLVTQDLMQTTNQAGQALTLKGVNYEQLIPILINAIKEQDQTIQAQQKVIRDLKGKDKLFEARISALENVK